MLNRTPQNSGNKHISNCLAYIYRNCLIFKWIDLINDDCSNLMLWFQSFLGLGTSCICIIWHVIFIQHLLTFLPRCMQCRRGLAMKILSVCPSVRLSVCHTRGLLQNGTKICPDLYTIWKNIYPSFLRRRMVGGGDPFYVKFWVNRPPLERNRRFLTNNRS